MRTIIVEPYNPNWPLEFEKIKAFLLPHIEDLIIDIIHVGSTSIPGLSAKPIIDFIIILDSYDVFPALAERLEILGYEHEGDLGIKQREAFKRKYKDEFMTYHMYVCPKDSPENTRQIAFWNYMCKHQEALVSYANLKIALAEQFKHDIDSYVNGKSAFIEEILKKAKAEGLFNG